MNRMILIYFYTYTFEEVDNHHKMSGESRCRIRVDYSKLNNYFRLKGYIKVCGDECFVSGELKL